MRSNESNFLWNKKELLQATKGIDLNNKFLDKQMVTGISIDTRTIQKGDLFIALKGKNFNGNTFSELAIKKGASGIITDDKATAIKFSSLLVKDTYKTLKNLAIFARKRFEGKVIAITGSNGKTSTKNMLSSALNLFGKTHSTFENNNNFLGLCLTLLRLKKNFEYCVIELGMNNKNELKRLGKIANPNSIIITNVSSSHLGNFKSEQQIAEEKSEIFNGLSPNGNIILNADDKWFNFLKNKALQHTKNIHSFGKKSNSKLKIKNISSYKNGTLLRIDDLDLFFKELPLHYVVNVSGVLVTLNLMHLNYKSILNKVCEFKPTFGRGNNFEIYLGNKGKVTIIDDSYNANPASMIAALKNIKEIKKTKPGINIVLVLGDMLELGKNTTKLHKDLIPYIKSIRPRTLVTVGEYSKIISQVMRDLFPCRSFRDVDELKMNFFSIIAPNDLILIKSSNGVGLFKFTKYLQNNFNYRS